MNSEIKFGFLGTVICGSLLSLELYGLEFLFSLELSTQGEVPVASAADYIMRFPFNIAFFISAALFLLSLFIVLKSMWKLKIQNK